jgi:drug/metabolite transporter (DMT)-like permease
MSQRHISVFVVLLAGLMWAIEPVLAKLSYMESSFITTLSIRAFIITILSFFYVSVIKKKSIKVPSNKLSALVYIALVGTLFADLLYFYALITIPVVNAVLIGHLQPIFIILISFILLKKDIPTPFEYGGIMLLMISAVLVTTKTMNNLLSLQLGSIGDAVVLLATIAWASTAIAMKKYLPMVDAGVITFYRFFIASLFFIGILFTNLPINLSIYQLLIGIVVTMGTICYYEGLKRLKAAQVSGLELSAPVFAAIIGFFILGETITWMQFIGICILFIGVYLISKKYDMKDD